MSEFNTARELSLAFTFDLENTHKLSTPLTTQKKKNLC